MDVGVTHFETERVRFTLLDAPVFHSISACCSRLAQLLSWPLLVGAGAP